METQYWDASAFVSLVLEERHSPRSKSAQARDVRRVSWDWMPVEVYSALCRRGAGPAHFELMRLYLADFKFIPMPESDAARAGLFRLLDRYRLRSADAGHLFLLKLAKKLSGKLEFVCFDDELTRAAESEGVRVFGRA